MSAMTIVCVLGAQKKRLTTISLYTVHSSQGFGLGVSTETLKYSMSSLRYCVFLELFKSSLLEAMNLAMVRPVLE